MVENSWKNGKKNGEAIVKELWEDGDRMVRT